MNIFNKNKNNKTNSKLIRKYKKNTCYRGGAARPSRANTSAKKMTARNKDFEYNNLTDEGNRVNIAKYTGIAHLDYLTKKYVFDVRSDPPLSDHAPVSYSIPDNSHIKLITWNVAQFGNEKYVTPDGKVTYNHKFLIKDGNLETTDGLETKEMYLLRLNALTFTFMDILNNIRTNNGKQSFLFCQELPYIPKTSKGSEQDKLIREIYDEFTKKLSLYGLGLNGSPYSECGLIYLLDDKSNHLTFIPELSDQRYSIYYSISKTVTSGKPNIYVYVNMHLSFNADFNKIIMGNIKNIQDFSNKNKFNLAAIYFIGDLNKSLLYQRYNFGISLDKIETYTTPNDEGFSYKNNNGETNKYNVDYLMKVNF